MSASQELAPVDIRPADLNDTDHQQAVLELLDHYSRDVMGTAAPLPDRVRRELIPRLRNEPGAVVLLAFVREQPVGLAICFRGFSTFQARPLLNIHDLAVHESYRGRGIGRALLEAVERAARAMDCGKLTLEVRADNQLARSLYRRFGFQFGDQKTDAMSFVTKPLS